MAKIPFWGVPGGFLGPGGPKNAQVPGNIFVGKKNSKIQNVQILKIFVLNAYVGNDLKTILVVKFLKKSTPSPRYGHFSDFKKIGGVGSNPTGRILNFWGPAVNFFKFCLSAKNIPFFKKFVMNA